LIHHSLSLQFGHLSESAATLENVSDNSSDIICNAILSDRNSHHVLLSARLLRTKSNDPDIDGIGSGDSQSLEQSSLSAGSLVETIEDNDQLFGTTESSRQGTLQSIPDNVLIIRWTSCLPTTFIGISENMQKLNIADALLEKLE
jgi:hypothetical protein